MPVVALLLAHPLPAHPDEAPCASPQRLAAAEALVPDLLLWISSHSEYDHAATPEPQIAFCRAGDRVQYEGTWIVTDNDLRGAYDLKNRRVWLVLPWSDVDPMAVSTLLHELVHHLQFAETSWPCTAAAEWEAYSLQHLWLEERGIASGFDLPQIRLRSRCPVDVHP
ncbi:MAG: DUF6647 family protein [Pseudomonadota bacterium]